MTGSGYEGAPLRAVAERAEVDASAFELLGDETRLAILLGLWEAYDPLAPAGTIGFTPLRKLVGIRDSGRFNYHLRKLLDTFVERADGGYRLRPTGLALVQAVVAGTGKDASLVPTEIGVDCHLCGAATEISYGGGWLYHRCTSCQGGFGQTGSHPEGVLFAEPLQPAALRERTPEQLYAMAVVNLLSVLSLKMAEICPGCSGAMTTSVDVCETHDTSSGTVCEACGNVSPVRVTWVCRVCKYRGSTSPAAAVALHPAVVAFYSDRGVDVGYPVSEFESARRLMDLVRGHEQDLLSTDPLRIEVTVRYDGDELRLLLDESLAAIEVDRPSPDRSTPDPRDGDANAEE